MSEKTGLIRTMRQSEINAYLKCGKLWEFRYVQNIVVPPRAALTVGTSVDRAVTHNLEQKIESGVDLPEGDVLDACATAFDKEAKETEFREGDNKDALKDMAVACTKLHHKELAPKIDPAAVQFEFLADVTPTIQVAGTMDIITKGDLIRDTKTAKASGANKLTGNVQAGVYDLGFEGQTGRRAKGFSFDVLVKTKVPKTEIVSGEVTDAHRAFTIDTLTQVDAAMRAGIALPASEQGYWCSPAWCGYWDRCKGKK